MKFSEYINEAAKVAKKKSDVFPYYDTGYDKNRNTSDGPTGGGYYCFAYFLDEPTAQKAAKAVKGSRGPQKAYNKLSPTKDGRVYSINFHAGNGNSEPDDKKIFNPMIAALKKAVPGIKERDDDGKETNEAAKFDIKKLKCAECDSTDLVMKGKKIFCNDCQEYVKAY